jgi:hypothetical protein
VPGVEQPQPAPRAGPGEESLAHAYPVQDPGDLVVQVDGAGEGIGPRMPFDDADVEATGGEQQGRRQADGSRADDEDDGGGGHRTSVIIDGRPALRAA